VEHAEHLPRTFPWRAATVVVGAIAALELVALIGIGATHIASSLRVHTTAAPAHAARAAQPVRSHVVKVATPPTHALRARAGLAVLVLNGNGVNGAAGREAVSLQTLGYGSSRSQDAPRHDYARSMVLFLPGYVREARRLAHDAGVALVAPVDGMSKAQLKGSPLVVVLGGR
jgi:hypothetical protein